MKICAYVNLYLPDFNAGAQTMMRDLLRPLKARGHEVVIVVHSPGGTTQDYEWEGIPVHPSVDRRTALHWVPAADLTIVMMEASERGAILAGKYGRKVVHVVHNTVEETHSYLAYPNDLTVYNSEYVQAAFPEVIAPGIVVHPPIDPDEYRTKHGGKVTLINMFRPKGTETFWEVARRMPNVEFMAVKGGYGPQDIREAPNVELHDNVVDMKQVYGKTKILLMPSSYESFGRVGIEAAASGIPTIAHPTPGLLESLGDAGHFVDKADYDGWVRKIKYLRSPRGYAQASAKAFARSKELAALSTKQMNVFVDAVEMLGGRLAVHAGSSSPSSWL